MATIGGFVTGAVVGFAAALVLQQLDRLPHPKVLGGPAPARAAQSPAEPSKPRFEFYEMLAKSEVLVPVLQAFEGQDKEDANAIYLLQAGSFRAAEDADRLRASLLLLGFNVETEPVSLDGTVWHRVMVGPFSSRTDLRHAQSRLRREDIDALPLSRKGNT